jgi:DNA-binding IclR family transcriptional regulator
VLTTAKPDPSRLPAAPEDPGARPSAQRERGIDRVLQLLDFLHRHGRPIRVGELARSLQAPRSSTYEIVRTLTDAGLLETGNDGRIFFGKTIYFYGADYLREHDLVRRGRDEVDRLALETGETTQLCMLHDGQYTIAYMRSGARMFRISCDVGTLVPVPWTASGRLLVADLDDAAIAAMLTPDNLAVPNRPPLALRDFIAEVRAARAAGFFMTSGLVDPYTHCMAAPVIDNAGRVVATICFTIPIDTPADRIGALRETLVASGRGLSIYPASPGRAAP